MFQICIIFALFCILLYAVEEGGFTFETTGIPIILYAELRCERTFSESYIAVGLVDVTKIACNSLEFSRLLYVISNGMKNCLRSRKKC